MDNLVLDYLSKLGYKNISTTYYDYIENWENYWKNNLDYLTYKDFYGTSRKMYSLGMAKRVSEDWASILWSDRDEINTDNEQNNEYVEEVFDDFDLSNRIPEAIEIASAYGTCGAIIKIKDAEIVNGVLQTNENTTKELILINAKQIVPLRREHNKIVDVAFVSETQVKEKDCYYLEIHQKTKDGYKISNIYIDKELGIEVANDDIVRSYTIPTQKPLFSLLMPPKVNPVKYNNGLGFSVFGDALDQLKAVDVAYNNFVMDLYLGGKKLIYNKRLIKYRQIKDSDGNIKEIPIYPDDISKQQFMEVGDISGVNDKELIHEYNPSLRVEENKNGIQIALNMLASKTMLGQSYYQVETNGSITATQYVGEKQDMVINAKKYRDRLNKFVSDIIKASLTIGRLIFNENVNEDCEVLIDNVDGFMVDQETAREQARQDLASGVISKVEYRMQVFHETEEEARKWLDEINNQYAITSIEEE